MTAPASFATGNRLLHLEIREGSEGFTWRRRLGPAAPSPFTPCAHLTAVASHPHDARTVPGSGSPGSRTYRAVRGARSAAAAFEAPGPAPDLTASIRGTGALLRLLHDHDGTPGAPPRPLLRLGDWLSGRAPDPRACYAERRLATELGAARTTSLHAWYSDLLTAPDRVRCHGAPGLGALVPTDTGGVDLLIGEDLGHAPRYFDIGWLLGELVAMQAAEVIDGATSTALRDALVAGYGDAPDERWVRVAVLRIALRLHDSIAYVGWDADYFARMAALLAHLVDRCATL